MSFLYTTVDAALVELPADISVLLKDPEKEDIDGFIQLDQLVSEKPSNPESNGVLLHVISKFLLDNLHLSASIEFTSDLLRRTFSLVDQRSQERYAHYDFEEDELEFPDAPVSPSACTPAA